jgi:hypothetical protein
VISSADKRVLAPTFSPIFNDVSEALAAEGFGLLVTYTDNLVTHQRLDSPFPPAYGWGEVDGIIAHVAPSAPPRNR